jgi:hypothetical protein
VVDKVVQLLETSDFGLRLYILCLCKDAVKVVHQPRETEEDHKKYERIHSIWLEIELVASKMKTVCQNHQVKCDGQKLLLFLYPKMPDV